MDTLPARLALVDGVRDLLALLAATDAGSAVLERAAAGVAAACVELAAGPQVPGRARRLDGPLTGLGVLSELGPFTTPVHAIAPPMALTIGVETVEAVATYGPVHEGGPGLVHGGFIAAAFDELLGAAQRGAVRMTGTLTIRYRAPAMLGRPLRYRAWLERIEGRKAFVAGTLHDGERLCAEGSAVFVELIAPPFIVPTG